MSMPEHATPVLRITDEGDALAFYRRLGFEVEWEHRFADDLPLFASIRRGGWHLFLSGHAGDAPLHGLVYLHSGDVDAVYEAWSAEGLGEPPTDQPYGMRELSVTDPAGNRLRVGTPLSTEQPPRRDRSDLARECYGAYESGDRRAVEELLTDDFTFFSPPDPGIDRDAYFERCWPNSERIQAFEFKRMAESGDEVLLTYEATRADGSRFCNTEVLTFDGDKICRAEVYFGWELD